MIAVMRESLPLSSPPGCAVSAVSAPDMVIVPVMRSPVPLVRVAIPAQTAVVFGTALLSIVPGVAGVVGVPRVLQRPPALPSRRPAPAQRPALSPVAVPAAAPPHRLEPHRGSPVQATSPVSTDRVPHLALPSMVSVTILLRIVVGPVPPMTMPMMTPLRSIAGTVTAVVVVVTSGQCSVRKCGICNCTESTTDSATSGVCSINGNLCTPSSECPVDPKCPGRVYSGSGSSAIHVTHVTQTYPGSSPDIDKYDAYCDRGTTVSAEDIEPGYTARWKCEDTSGTTGWCYVCPTPGSIYDGCDTSKYYCGDYALEASSSVTGGLECNWERQRCKYSFPVWQW